MKYRSIKIRTLIILFSLLLVGCEFFTYYFFDDLKLSLAIAVLPNLLLLHIYLESSLSYLSCFLHSTLITLLSTSGTLLIYYQQTGNLLVYNPYLPLLILLNWLVPMLYAILRDLNDHGPRFVNFRAFFIRSSILFGIFYVLLFTKYFFITPMAFPATLTDTGNPYVPFLASATYIEDVIYLGHPLMPLILYLTKIVLAFLPIGFYTALLLREHPRYCLALITLFAPLLIECIPLLYGESFSMDVYLWTLIGTLVGILLFKILNAVSNYSLKCDFLTQRNNYRFFNLYY